MAYDFHYTPTGTGVISGKEVLEQTEDAINDLGNTAISGVQEALDKAEQALTNSENAVDDAQTALNTANNAEGVAIQAQTDVGNLSGTVTNIGNRVTTAEGNITNLQGRMTTAEGNITNLQGRMTTAESDIGNLQTAVSTAQATANSAQQTATTARQQSYVLRYSSSSVTDNSTIAYSTLDNTDNIKSGDKIIDVDGKIFSIVSVDTANQTVTVGTALIDLALDANVVHTSGNETVGGMKELSEITTFAGSSLGNEGSSNARTCMYSYCNRDTKDYSGIYQRRVRQSRAQGQMSGNDISQYAFDILENQVRTNNVLYFVGRDFTNDIPKTMYIASQCDTRKLGSSLYPWSDTITNQINGIEPSSLSLPSGNTADRVDISSYITAFDGTSNTYTPLANGWISISANNCTEIYVFLNNLWGVNNTQPTAGAIRVMIPVLKGVVVAIRITGGTLGFARFIPCQGNV